MTQSKQRKLAIDQALFRMAFDRDVEFQDEYSQSIYLNLGNGEIHWVYEKDKDAEWGGGIPAEENRTMRERIEAAPDRYLLIPGLHHGDHHKILQEFLDSDWTDNKETWSNAQDAYSRSIGRWIKAVDEGVVHAYYAFRDYTTKQMAEEFLREHGIEPQWK